ncbi:MAG: SMP-30/gluconolactonase/LRE family protein [Planctomycetaceae bacterium]|nr:SMP-30/gluconolactonase/LRE family protein [Planctomycetaceae bacterium]
MRALLLAVLGLSFAHISLTSAAEPVVNRDAPLETIKTDFGLADGPSWTDKNSLYVPDVKGETLYQFWPKADRWATPLQEKVRISASYFNRGQLFVSDNGNSRIAVLNGNQLETLVQHDPAAKPAQKPNDLVVDVHGNIYYTLTGPGEVRYLPQGSSESLVVAKLAAPNGIILSPDEATLYVSAYADKQIWSYPLSAPGKAGEGSLFATMDDGPEKGADGMSIDRAGNVYCCGAADVWIWTPAGELIEKINTPTRPINCSFGGSDMNELYITGFGGLYRQAMRISGRSPEPAPFAEATESSPSTVLPENVTAYHNIPYAQYGTRKVLADIFVPQSKAGTTNPAVIVVHGGGWMKGDKTKFRALSLELARRGYTTMAIEYRLGGEAPFPAAIHDCLAASRYLHAHAKKYSTDPQRIYAMGGSAGGHLVGLMATGAGNPQLEGNGGWADASSKLKGAIVMAGPMQIGTGDVAERSKTGNSFYSNLFIGGSVDENPEGYQLADAYEKITPDDCPILFLVGELDKPERNAPSREKLQAAGVKTGVVVYPDAKHGCWNQLPWLTQFAEDADQFFQSLEH